MDTLFPDQDSPGPGRMSESVDMFAQAADGGLPAPMVEHLRFLAGMLDEQAATNLRWSRAGRPLPPGMTMAAMQVSREFREALEAARRLLVERTAGDDPIGAILAQLSAPIVGDSPHS